jgi:hypothetical protein
MMLLLHLLSDKIKKGITYTQHEPILHHIHGENHVYDLNLNHMPSASTVS